MIKENDKRKFSSSEINDFIRENMHLGDKDLSAILGISRGAVEHRRRNMNLHRTDEKLYDNVDHAIKEDIEKRRQRVQRMSSDEKYEILLEEIEKISKERDAIKEISSVNTYRIKKAGKGDGKSEAVAVMLASDWHVEERVEKQVVNNLNEFDLDIAKKRSEAFFVNSLRLIEVYKKEITIKRAVLALLGDFISGSIHEELMEGNNLPPVKALLFAQELIASGINYLLENSDLEEIIIPCHSGNHGRATVKQRHATEAGNSFEFFMYHSLAKHFKNEKRVKFIIPESYLSYLEIFDTTIRFHHGHAIKYGGGIGGIFISAFKAISQWNKSRWATIDCFGHFHQQRNGGNFLCNGSLIGYNGYAVSIKAEYEKPAQTFFLVHNKHGIETVTKIRLE